MIDHRYSPGISPELLKACDMPMEAGRGFFEAATYTCSHCQRVVIINPLRNRDRAYCRKCDHYICDQCGAVMAATLECKTFKQIIDEVQNAVATNQPVNILLPGV